MMEQKENRVEVQAKSVDDVKAMVYFMSTNQLPKDANCWNLIHLAHYYQIDRLFNECVFGILQLSNINNFISILRLFDKYRIETGYDALVTYAKKNKMKLKESKDYDTIPHAFKCILLK